MLCNVMLYTLEGPKPAPLIRSCDVIIARAGSWLLAVGSSHCGSRQRAALFASGGGGRVQMAAKPEAAKGAIASHRARSLARSSLLEIHLDLGSAPASQSFREPPSGDSLIWSKPPREAERYPFWARYERHFIMQLF